MAKYKTPIRVNVDTAQVAALVDRIRGLDKRAGRAAIKKGLNEVTKMVLWTARGMVPSRSGMLRKSLGRKIVTASGGAKFLGIVKPRGGPKYRKEVNGRIVNPVKYAHLVEFGRVAVVVKKKTVLSTGKGGIVFGTHVRAVPPRPFMRPAWATNEPRTVPILHKWLTDAIAKYWAKTRR